PERDLVHAGDGRRAVAEELLRDEEADPEECGVACQWHEEQRRAEHADAEGDGTRGAEGTPHGGRDQRPAEARQAAGREDQPEDTRSQSEFGASPSSRVTQSRNTAEKTRKAKAVAASARLTARRSGSRAITATPAMASCRSPTDSRATTGDCSGFVIPARQAADRRKVAASIAIAC